jgi:flagellar L-ring protein FlgH
MITPYKFIFSLAAFLAASTGSALASPVEGSLWMDGSNTERGMFADKNASRIGDIITIEISETSSIASSVKLSTSKESTVKNDFTKLLFSDVLRSHGEAPSTDLTTANNTHAGTGSLDNSHQITAEISVQVIDVLPNGNLVLEGTRVITYAGETYYMLTQGICRPDDITTGNTVTSGQLADARIEIVSEGSLNEAEREGWGEKLANKVSP